jgi:hypothetical protein
LGKKTEEEKKAEMERKERERTMKIPRGQAYRKQVRNGRVVVRQVVATRVGSRAGRPGMRGDQGGAPTGSDGARVLWAVILLGTLIASGFILALQSEEQVYQLGRADANLKADFLDLANRQRVEESRLQEALDAAEREVLENRSRREVIQPSLQRTALRTQLASRFPSPKRERETTVPRRRQDGGSVTQVLGAAQQPVTQRGNLSEGAVVLPIVQTRPRRISSPGAMTNQTQPE